MNENLLITFGCSWTYGVGVGYTIGMPLEEYMQIAWDKKICDRWSYRGEISTSLHLDNLNFAAGGNSNQIQFYYAKKYFGSDQFLRDQKTYKKIIVLHAITSTARNFFFDLEIGSIRHVGYGEQNKFAEFMVKHSYDPNFEIEQLEIEMNFWNRFYKSTGINHLWVDTFNHHNYNSSINNFLSGSTNRDLMSQLCVINNVSLVDTNSYHRSAWKVDDPRVSALINCNVLNPISKHPTQQGHQQIAKIIQPIVKSLL